MRPPGRIDSRVGTPHRRHNSAGADASVAPQPALPTIAGMVERALLADVELFDELHARRARPASPARRQARTLRRGDVLFTEGDDPAELFVVPAGRIAIANRSIDGRESVVALMERGDLFGEMPLFDGLGRSAEARALEPSRGHRHPVRRRSASCTRPEPTLLWSVVALLAGRLRTMDAALADAVFLDVTGRTAKRLLELAGEADEFALPDHPGGARRDGRRVPGAGEQGHRPFVRLGWIEQTERRYRITNREQLDDPGPLSRRPQPAPAGFGVGSASPVADRRRSAGVRSERRERHRPVGDSATALGACAGRPAASSWPHRSRRRSVAGCLDHGSSRRARSRVRRTGPSTGVRSGPKSGAPAT